MKKLLVLGFIATLAGCADSHNLNVSNTEVVNKIPASSSVYVALSEDGRYGEKDYKGSGVLLSNVIKSGLLTKMNDITLANEAGSFKESIKLAESNGSDYLFYPTIMHWEDRATEWSAKADKVDKVEVKIVTWGIKNNVELSSAIIDGSSGLATLGGDHPQDLLPEPVNAYIDTLFAVPVQN
ncbi:DUF4823 domain-containing protein [Aliivibrio sp. 1S128]|uniref:DUF4823 domain-containing protein n=1 Tax=Aliivibrio sp. 1S128 TaxID=1840085 RepID=UPI00080E3D2C|nr:DUF4823 domain-containing protein [Aliivibrio sp. 1S128]OCH12425.1 DUF4823 domain-containing protein [Aliivibrio sp. 1S128]